MLATSKEIKVQKHIVETINRIYNNCYYVNIRTNRYERYCKTGQELIEQHGCYTDKIEELVEQYVRKEDKEQVVSMLSRRYIGTHLTSENVMYTFECRGGVSGALCRCNVMFLNAGEDRELEHFALVLEMAQTPEEFEKQEDERRQKYYEELRKALIYQELYRGAVLGTGIVVYHVNISKDLIESNFTQKYNEQDIGVLPVVGLEAPCSYEEYTCRWAERVSKDTLEEYNKIDTCQKLLDLFDHGVRIVAVQYRSEDTMNRDVFIQKNILMERNSMTGDVMGLCYLTLVNHGINDTVDEVTGLSNQNGYTRFLEDKIKAGEKLVIIKFGIEAFSHVNIMYGFDNANQVLRMFANKLVKFGEGRFEVYRTQGIKFSCCLKDATEDELQEIYGEIQRIAQEDIQLAGSKIPMKVYGGAIIMEGYHDTVESLRSIGTYVLNKSKNECHGGLVIFSNLLEENQIDFEMLGTIHRSINEGYRGFYMCYQPIADPESGRIVGMEALLRWRGEPYGNVPPGKFVPWLESDPVFYELGSWILRQAMTDAMKIKKNYPEFILNVNVAAIQIEHSGFEKQVLGILEETGYPPQDLCMELTERCRDVDFGLLRRKMEYFQSLGIKIAMDDFGTGNASLSLLKELPVDELKVDMTFIRNIKGEPVHQALVRSIVQCANELGLKSCLEGVEDEELIEYLKQFCATYYQGYYYSKPVEIEEFMGLLD